MNVSIVGAGPVGCIAARYGVEKHDITIYDGGVKGRRMQCSGLVSKKGLNSLDICIKNSLIQNKVRGVRLFPPSGEVVEVDGKNTKAYVVNRIDFDEYLRDKVSGWGVDVVEKQVKAQDISYLTKKFDRVVLATGTDYSLHRALGLDTPDEFLYGAQYEMKLDCDPDFVEMHFNSPDFFSWVIPVDDCARVGVCARSNPVPHLHRFIKHLGSEGRVSSYAIRNEHYGCIPIHKPSIRTSYGKILLVGDAAGQVKASTGGGIVMGGRAGSHIYDPNYEVGWRRHIGNELRLHLMIYRFFSRLSDKGRNRLFSIINEHRDALERGGDMDSAYKSLSSLFRNPVFAARFISNLPGFTYDLLS